MPTRFAALQSRVNVAVLRSLGNAQAQLVAGGLPFTVIYDVSYEAPLGISALQPVAMCQADVAAAIPTEATLLIDPAASPGEAPGIGALRFSVRDREDADGLVRLMLERLL